MIDERLVRVDCHVHSYRSGDSRTSLEQIECAAVEAGLDYVCITDHGTIEGAEEARESFSQLEVIVGQECRTWAGEIIGLFLSKRIPGNLQPEAVIEAIKAQQGLVYLPHPCCPMHNGLRGDFIDRLMPFVDIIEVHNGKVGKSGNREARELAMLSGKAQGAGSDAHYAEFIGKVYVEIPEFVDAGSFLEALQFRGASIKRGSYSHTDATWPIRGRA